ncbi:hypothetical protein [Lapillicoccus jejuensis]|uniref:Uncharacterized protein n=1 Tax=Lapillicoccus jejuensis TaxID=402171 RepID=A0A542E0J4_9MICO|nr:hypothetical protein [Lapillicoccus jejuensis]TQJ08704.1 hypothetical protein FB458_1796 [Lapillicoccus jejuensis]
MSDPGSAGGPGPAATAAAEGRARHLIAMRRPDDALAVLGPAIAAAPDQARLLGLAAHAHLVRADVRDDAGDPVGSRRDYELGADLARRAAAADPHDEWGHRLLSIALVGLRSPYDAAHAADRAVRLEPFSYLTHLQYARALAAVGSPEAHERAWAAGRRAAELAPQEPAVHLLMAQLAHPTSGSSPQGLAVAEQALRRTLELDPGNSSALNDLARIQLRRRRGVAAITGFVHALRVDPRNGAARHNLGVVLAGWLRPAHWTVLAAVWVALLGQGAQPAPTGPWVVRSLCALVVVAVVVVVGLRLRRAVPGQVGAVLRQLPVVSRWAAAWAWCLAVSVAGLVVSGLVPLEVGTLGVGVAFVAVHLGTVCSWVWAARSR